MLMLTFEVHCLLVYNDESGQRARHSRLLLILRLTPLYAPHFLFQAIYVQVEKWHIRSMTIAALQIV